MINNSFSSNLTQVHLYASSGLSWSTEDKTSKLENEAEAEAEEYKPCQKKKSRIKLPFYEKKFDFLYDH